MLLISIEYVALSPVKTRVLKALVFLFLTLFYGTIINKSIILNIIRGDNYGIFRQ